MFSRLLRDTCLPAGLIAGCPTTVVPFFGDQPFWGAACARMGVGPKPIPIDKLDTPSLVEALQFMMKPEVQAAAQETGQGIKHVCYSVCFAYVCFLLLSLFDRVDLLRERDSVYCYEWDFFLLRCWHL